MTIASVLSWTGSEDCFYASDENLEAQQALGSALYREGAQSIPSIESVGDSDSDDEDEDIIFSGLHNSHQEEPLTQEGPHPSSRQTSAKPLYSWQPSSPGTRTHISTSWSSLSQGHAAEVTPKPQNQQLNGPHLSQVAQITSITLPSQEDDRMSSTAGWFSGAAGQLAASRDSTTTVDELAEHSSRQDEHPGTETEEEVERAFQQSVQGTSDPAPTNMSVQLTAAVHDMDIDHLLQKLICGEIEYNPHDPNSGLPPASSLFTDSEASSEAEEDRAALHNPAQSQSAVLSNKTGQAAGVPANKETSLQQDGTAFKQSQLMVAPSSINQGFHQQGVSNTNQKQGNNQTRTASRTYIRHRQTSRLANRFQQHADFDADDSVAEEFDEWRASRAHLKQKSQY